MPLQILKNVFGYDGFRPGQGEVVEALLAGEHALAVMPTGSGKSLCFQIPAILKGGLTIVVSPLVALMEDQVAALKLAGVAADTINSSRNRDINVAAWKRAAAGKTRLLYLSPERLMTERMLFALARLPVNFIAIDEAHCLSRWGPSFRPEYEALARLKDIFPGVPIVALTATADDTTQNDITAKLFGGAGRRFVTGFDRPNIRLGVEMRTNAKAQLLRVVKAHEGESGIVYCLSRAKTEKMARFLNDNGVRALPYHAGMDAEARTRNQDAFMKEAGGVVIVATIAFGMGIDKPDVRFVCHTDMPGNVEAYYQEIGRAGRDGKPAVAHMIYGLDDLRMRRMFIEQEDGGADHKRREHKRLDALISYCESPECRRHALLAYFGETRNSGAGCGNCDICLDPPEMIDGDELAGKLLSTAVRTGQVFGQAHLIDVVRGADTDKIRSTGHDKLPTYGTGADLDRNEWRSFVRQLVAAGFLRIDVAGHGGLSLTEKGQSLLDGQVGFFYRKDVIKQAAAKKERRKRSAAAAVPEDLNADQIALLGRLKDKRAELARKRNVPAYIVFSDRSLEDMARWQPRDATAFADIHGVGAAKLKKFADAFLAVIAGQAS